ncbi:hypothetical protein GCM10009612_09330 [Streptomyces beijiangensis]
MKAGSTFAYELTQSIATKGAIRQIAMITRAGVTTGGGFSSGMRCSVPSLITCCNAQEIYARALTRRNPCPHTGMASTVR